MAENGNRAFAVTSETKDPLYSIKECLAKALIKNSKRYDDAKIGIFIHWGVFSVPSFHSEWLEFLAGFSKIRLCLF